MPKQIYDKRFMTLEPPTLIGKHVRLLPLEERHLEGLITAASAPEIWNYLPAPQPKSLVEMQKIAEEAWTMQRQGIEIPLVIEFEGRIVGSTRICDISLPNNNCEIGWTWHHPSVWRTPVNTECKFLLLSYLFDQQKLTRVFLKTDLRNERSQQAIARLGAVREGIWRKHRVMHDGHIRSTVYFSILDDEWPQIKQHLAEKIASYSV
jgi:N-acetyltransferase